MTLKWTRTPPTEAGVYLRKHPTDGVVDACVVYRQDEIDGGNLMYSGAMYHGGLISEDADSGALWAGPIESPEETSPGAPS